MPTRSRTIRKNKSFGRNIVRAWFDTVLNPLLSGLAEERRELLAENWTWRFRPPRLLSFMPVRSYLMAEAWDNPDQFLSFHPEFRRFIDRHDQRVDSLFQACQSFHRALTESEVLQEAYHRTTTELSQRTGGSVSDFFGAEPPENHLGVLAEYIVNRAVKLPHYYATAPLWNEHSEEFLRMRESAGVRPHWEATRRAGAELRRAVDDLSGHLKATRDDLSLEYDVPFVFQIYPVEPKHV
jgi:hypothetical protein